jgi:hypothetical protein
VPCLFLVLSRRIQQLTIPIESVVVHQVNLSSSSNNWKITKQSGKRQSEIIGGILPSLKPNAQAHFYNFGDHSSERACRGSASETPTLFCL